MDNRIILREMGLQPYRPTVARMQALTDARTPDSPDEVWTLQHCPVYTLGQAGDRAHVLNSGDIEVVETDRGGQVTYHGPGQLVFYTMVDLRRRKIGVRGLVSSMEDAVIAFLEVHGVHAFSKPDAPGVYVGQNKVAALGLRVRRGCSFHGLALNVNMNLAPYSRINPCGFEGLGVTQLSELGIDMSVDEVGRALFPLFEQELPHWVGKRSVA
jgi:lipoyl(octanoyl) transferase